MKYYEATFKKDTGIVTQFCRTQIVALAKDENQVEKYLKAKWEAAREITIREMAEEELVTRHGTIENLLWVNDETIEEYKKMDGIGHNPNENGLSYMPRKK